MRLIIRVAVIILWTETSLPVNAQLCDSVYTSYSIENDLHAYSPEEVDSIAIFENREVQIRQIYNSSEVQLLLEAGIPCSIEIKMYVNCHGKLVSYDFIDSCHPLAKKAILDQVDKFLFRPALKDGIYVNSWVTWYYHWTIR